MGTINGIIFRNQLKLILFIILITAIIMLLGYVFTMMFHLGINGLIVTFIIAAAVNFFSYFNSKNIVLKSQHAIRMQEYEFPLYYDMVREMCFRNNIIPPELYYINSSSLNAFATGRNQKNAAVVVTTGLLNNVPLEEIKGIVGHELAHIVHKDILITSFIGTMIGFIAILTTIIRSTYFGRHNRSRRNTSSPIILIGILAATITPVVGTLIRMAVSRSREYMADAKGAEICANPKLLAKALYRISHNGHEMPYANEATAPMYIANPLNGDFFENLFSTHPDINDRIRRLENM